MADRTVSVRLQAVVTDYMTKMSAASKATVDLANKVDNAKGRSREGFQMIGRTALIGGAAVVAGFGYAVKSAADFGAKMALVKTLSHATGEEMAQLHDAALHVGQAYGFTAGEVADAEAELVKAGISVKDVLGGALTGALTLAAAGQTNVAEATEIAATAMTQFQLSGKDVPHIADLLAAGADKALGSVGDLGYALDQSGLTAHTFGISIEETVGTLASFAQAGQVGERGGTVFAQMLAQLSAPSKQASNIMKDLGINVYDANGQFVGMANLAGQLHDKLGNLTQAERTHDLQVIFGQRAVRGANILYQEGAAGIEEWTKAVNDNGFAAMQAAGKMDSLSGDLTKLKSALQVAFIGVGEGANGPLRTIVKDVTAVIDAWNELPGPVKRSVEALVLAGGAVTFVGGAAVLFIPKWTAMNAALAETRMGAISAQKSLGMLGKASLVLGGLTALDFALEKLHGLLQATPPEADALTGSLLQLGDTGRITGQLHDIMSDLELLAQAHPMRKAGASEDLDAIGQSLAGLVQSGHLDEAKAAFGEISQRLQAAGQSTDEISQLFPDFNRALADSATQAQMSADGVDNYGNAVTQAAKDTKKATDAAKAYSDQLHALADPLFAMNQALQDVHAKQKVVTEAIKKHGAASKAARRAQLDLASSSLDVEAAASSLAASVEDGTTSLGDSRKMLQDWVRDGLVTKSQADAIRQSFKGIIDTADQLNRTHPHLRVSADTHQAVHALDRVRYYLGLIHDKNVDVRVRTLRTEQGPGGQLRGTIPGQAAGGPVYGPGSGTSDSILRRLSNGEFIVRSDGSNLSDAYRYFSARSSTHSGAAAAASVTYNVTNNYPEPERPSDSTPRSLREAAYVSGNAW